MKRVIAVLLFLLAQSGWATVYYVRPTNGSDGNAGTSFAAAFQTAQKALDTAAGGDEIRLCAEAVETPTATVDIDGAYTDADLPLLIYGANSTDGSVDGTVYTLSGASLPDGVDLCAAGLNADYVTMRYIRLTAGKDDNLTFEAAGAGSNISRWTIADCRIDNAADDGVYCTQTSNDGFYFSDCEVDNNGGDGFGINSYAARGYGGAYLRCSIHDNGGDAIQDAETIVNIDSCLIFGNGGDGYDGSEYGQIVTITNSLFFDNAGSGLYIRGPGPYSVSNSVFRLNGAYGIDTNGEIPAGRLIEDYNCFHSNVSGALDAGSIGPHSITSDPKFTSETDGAEDFMPQADSPLLEAGIDGGQW